MVLGRNAELLVSRRQFRKALLRLTQLLAQLLVVVVPALNLFRCLVSLLPDALVLDLQQRDHLGRVVLALRLRLELRLERVSLVLSLFESLGHLHDVLPGRLQLALQGCAGGLVGTVGRAAICASELLPVLLVEKVLAVPLRVLEALPRVLQTPLRITELVTEELVVVVSALDLVGCVVGLVPNPLVFGLELQWRAGGQRRGWRGSDRATGGRHTRSMSCPVSFWRWVCFSICSFCASARACCIFS